MKLKLSEFFLYLIKARPFYGRLASSLARVARPGLGTLAVGIKDRRPTLFYDPEFLAKIPLKAAVVALEHEMLHLVLDHIPRYLEMLALCADDLQRKKASVVYNIAMDAAINDLLRKSEGYDDLEAFILERLKELHPNLPPSPCNGLVLPEKFDLPPAGSFEKYQRLLMQRVEIIEIAMTLPGGSCHDMWTRGDDDDGGEGEGVSGSDGGGASASSGGQPGKDVMPGRGGGGRGADKQPDLSKFSFPGASGKDMDADELMSEAQQIREQMKNALRSAVRSMGGVGRGFLPAEVSEFLDAYIADPIVPWWEIFSTRARATRQAKLRRSATVPNRALLALSEEDPSIIPMPGRVRDKTWRVFLYVDTSGSMSSESLEIARSELFHMLAADEGMEIRYMQGDAITQSDILLKTGDDVPTEMKGRGGTDFDEYFKHMQQYVSDESTTPDLVIVYTDGGCSPVRPELRLPQEIPVIWLVTPGHSKYFHQDGYGELITCDPSHNGRYNN